MTQRQRKGIDFGWRTCKCKRLYWWPRPWDWNGESYYPDDGLCDDCRFDIDEHDAMMTLENDEPYANLEQMELF